MGLVRNASFSGATWIAFPGLLSAMAVVTGCASGGAATGGDGGSGASVTASGTTTSTATQSTTTSTTATSGGPGGGGAGGGDPGPALLGLQNTSGWQIYAGGGYRYGPSIMVHPDASIDMWTCSPGANGAWDYVRYRHSSDGGHVWTDDSVAIQPSPGTKDAFSSCDPGAVKIGNYYYVGYTSTENAAGTQNELYLGRSTSPSGPFEKWSGSGWGNDPHPIVTYGGASTAYGIGEPSLLYQGGKLYVYYTDDDETGGYTDLSIVNDPTTDDWPLHLENQGHVIVHAGAQDSIDVKYADAFGRFVAVSTFDRFGPNATVAVYQSQDGITFERTPFLGARIQPGAHNMGLSGDEAGHLTGTFAPFIAYAYQPPGSSWGDWPTFLDPVALQGFDLGTVVGGGVSSIVAGTDWNWSGPRSWDGDAGSVFSSDSHGATDVATEWAFVDLGRSLPVAKVTISPRPGGSGFPIDYVLQSSDDGTTWADIAGTAVVGHASPALGDEVVTLATPVTTRFVRVMATRLGPDDFGNHYLQLAEISIGL